MKKLITMTIMVLAVAVAMAQAPEKFTYQAVVRNASNQLVANAPVSVRVSILQGGVNGTLVYMEDQTATTNANGLITLQIGGGTVQQGVFANIDWANGPFFLKTETDPNGGSDYTVTNTQQLLSVPYALYAREAGNSFSGDYNDLTNTPTIPTVPANVSAFTNDAGYITIDSVPAIPTNVSAFSNDAGYLTNYTETDPVFNAWDKDYDDLTNKPTLFSGDYNDLTNQPTIPSVPADISVFNNDAGYITSADIPSQVNADWEATAGVAQILHKPTLFSGNYNDLTNKPTLFSGSYNDLTDKPTLFSGNYNDLTNKPTLFSGNYNDLTNKPVLFSGSYYDLNDRPVLFDGDYNSLNNRPNLATVATTGSYNDLSEKPTIPTIPTNVSAFSNDAGYITSADIPEISTVPTNVSAFTNDAGYITSAQIPSQVNADWNATTGAAQILNKPTIPTVPYNVSAFINDAGYITKDSVPAIPTNVSTFTNDAGYLSSYTETDPQFNAWDKNYNDLTNKPTLFSGNYNDLTNKPSLFDGDYNSLSNRPMIPTVPDSVSAFINDAGYITAADVQAAAGIPTNVSAFTNDAGYITANDVPAQMNADWNATTGVAAILNKPTIPSVPTNVSAFTNDSHYITEVELSNQLTAMNNALAALYSTIDSLQSRIEELEENLDQPIPAQTLGSVTTSPMTYVGVNSAVGGGNVISDGNGSIIARGICWSTSYPPYVTDSHTNDGSTVGPFTSTATGLNPGTTYYVRAYVTNSVGTAYGDTVSFTTTICNTPTFPTVTMDSVTNILPYTATFHGNVVNDGCSMLLARGFSYRAVDSDPSIWRNFTVDVVSEGAFSATVAIDSLDANKTFYVRAYATNSVGTKIADSVFTFVSSKTPPLVTTNNTVTNITYTSAMCGGNVTFAGGSSVTKKGLCFGLNENPTIQHDSIAEYTGSGLGAFTCTMTGLTDNTVYHVRAYATNSVGTNYGEDRVFSTLAYLPPSVEILSPTGITYTSFTCSGNVTNEGSYSVIERGIGYSTTPIPSEEDTYIPMGSGPGTFDTIISGLTPNTTYYVWAYARNNIGQQANSERIPVTTLANTVPEVATLYVSELGNCTGKVISTGGLPITDRGFCYSIYSTMPDTTEYRVSVGSGRFSALLPNMTNNQSYYVRAYAINDTGIAYGATIQFIYHTCGGSVTVTDYDYHVYHTVKIGGQCWMKENLITTHYADGTPVEPGNNNFSTTVAYYYTATNGYGLLYNWAAVMHGASSPDFNLNPSGVRGICPIGWHVPGHAEWEELMGTVSSNSAYRCNGDEDKIAKSLAAATTAWYSSTNDCAVGNEPSANNATGFGAFPAGAQVANYSYSGASAGKGANFWSATEYPAASESALSRALYYDYAIAATYTIHKNCGLSVRCLRD